MQHHPQPHDAAQQRKQSRGTMIATAAAITVLVCLIAVLLAFHFGWFTSNRSAAPAPTPTPSTGAMATSASPTATPSPSQKTAAEPAREIARTTWRELTASAEPLFVGHADGPVIADPTGPYLRVNDTVLHFHDGEFTAVPNRTTQHYYDNIWSIRDGWALAFSTPDGPGPAVFDLVSGEELYTPPDFLAWVPSHHELAQVRLAEDDQFFIASVTKAERGGAPTQTDPRTLLQLVSKTGEQRWQAPIPDIAGADCSGWFAEPGVSSWLLPDDPKCRVAVRARDGAVVHYAAGMVIATYDEHLVVYDPDAERFISYDADGNQERSFAVHAAALKMISPYAAYVNRSHSEAFEHQHFDRGGTVDYGLEVPYPDLVKGLAAMEAAGVAPVSDDGVLSTMKWEILPGGEVLELDMRTEGHSILSPLHGGVHWDLACANVKVIAGGSRAICQGGEDDGTLFQLNDNGTSAPLWKDPNGFGFAMKIFPFNHNQWVVYSDNKVWVLGSDTPQ